MEVGSELKGDKSSLNTIGFGENLMLHKRRASAFPKSSNKNDSFCFLNIVSPQDSNCGRLTTRMQSEPSVQISKYISMITKLNEEIQILSSQLKESNEIISHFTVKLSEISKNFLSLKEITEKLRLKVAELEKDNFQLSEENEILKKSKSNSMKKIHLEKNKILHKNEETTQELILEQKLDNVLKENYYNEVIKKLNSKFLQGVDEIITKYKKYKKSGVNDENINKNITDLKGFFSSECRSIIKKNLDEADL